MAYGNFTIEARPSVGTDGTQILTMSLDGDDSYPAGGTADFQEAMRDGFIAASNNVDNEEWQFKITGVSQGESGDNILGWLPADDKLFVRQISDGVQVAGDQSGERYVITLHAT